MRSLPREPQFRRCHPWHSPPFTGEVKVRLRAPADQPGRSRLVPVALRRTTRETAPTRLYGVPPVVTFVDVVETVEHLRSADVDRSSVVSPPCRSSKRR